MIYQPLNLEAYRSEIHLDEPFSAPPPAPELEDERAGIVDELLAHLKADGTAALNGIHLKRMPSAYEEKRRLLQALLTVRNPDPLPDWFHAQMNRLLQYENSQQIGRIAQYSEVRST